MSKYGISAVMGDTRAYTAVRSETHVLFIGQVETIVDGGSALVHCSSLKEYEDAFLDESSSMDFPLSRAAELVFDVMNLSDAWFLAIGDQEDDLREAGADVTAAIATMDSYISRIYIEHGIIPNIVNCVGNLHSSIIAKAVSLMNNLNNEEADNTAWNGIVLYDVPVASNQYGSDGRVSSSNVSNITPVSTSPIAKGCWPGIRFADSGNQTYESSPAMAALWAIQDSKNEGNIPFRSLGNLPILCTGAYAGSTHVFIPQNVATEISDKGIETINYLGSGKYVTWGDTMPSASDRALKFDSDVRMVCYLLNWFRQKWASVIDDPMTLSLRNDIIAGTQAHLDYLVSIGALLGTPTVGFKSAADDVSNGEFYFDGVYTVTPPARYIQLKTHFTSEGFNALIEE